MKSKTYANMENQEMGGRDEAERGMDGEGGKGRWRERGRKRTEPLLRNPPWELA